MAAKRKYLRTYLLISKKTVVSFKIEEKSYETSEYL
jgi:hypothetical protein